ncbi:GerMN domain-containing protein [Pseudothermotoga thermarum]|uniref:Lipoprotein LpqB, GerMN domain protein n=1 Tax=Pseudothermotoga thermarum DSM 5069 TaxID=688269 RepID=F7YYF3_9THEM|nr:GerMN domain-containing protein [Pseudothermotoga thermarum]AEH50977.1 Lipoprotein LpqB, GerMN domain protein [Pseudothermotoga thermarum DSM 5069]
MRMFFVLVIIAVVPMLLLAANAKVVYFDDHLNPSVVNVSFQKDEDIVLAIFNKLASPSSNFKTFVPADVLNAYFFVETALVLDLKSSSLKAFDFLQERYFLHQVLFSIFNTFGMLDRVYILIDGKRSEVLAKYVDIRYSFPREIWVTFPVQSYQH